MFRRMALGAMFAVAFPALAEAQISIGIGFGGVGLSTGYYAAPRYVPRYVYPARIGAYPKGRYRKAYRHRHRHRLAHYAHRRRLAKAVHHRRGARIARVAHRHRLARLHRFRSAHSGSFVPMMRHPVSRAPRFIGPPPRTFGTPLVRNQPFIPRRPPVTAPAGPAPQAFGASTGGSQGHFYCVGPRCPR